MLLKKKKFLLGVLPCREDGASELVPVRPHEPPSRLQAAAGRGAQGGGCGSRRRFGLCPRPRSRSWPERRLLSRRVVTCVNEPGAWCPAGARPELASFALPCDDSG